MLLSLTLFLHFGFSKLFSSKPQNGALGVGLSRTSEKVFRSAKMPSRVFRLAKITAQPLRKNPTLLSPEKTQTRALAWDSSSCLRCQSSIANNRYDFGKKFLKIFFRYHEIPFLRFSDSSFSKSFYFSARSR